MLRLLEISIIYFDKIVFLPVLYNISVVFYVNLLNLTLTKRPLSNKLKIRNITSSKHRLYKICLNKNGYSCSDWIKYFDRNVVHREKIHISIIM